MNDLVLVRRFEAAEWAAYRDLRLRALGESPDAFSSTLEIEQPRADDFWAARLSAAVASQRDLPLLALVSATPAGLAWARVDQADASRVNLFQMWVAPEFRSRGLGGRLLQAAIAWARARGANRVCLGVTVAESPAMRMYVAAGFRSEGSADPLRPGSKLLAQRMELHLDAP